jgi:hypothetical protein
MTAFRPLLLSVALCLPGAAALAQQNKIPHIVDHSNSPLIDKAAATKMLEAGIPAKVWKVYSPRQWGFISEVEGGFTAQKICVVAARVTMIPLTVTLKAPLMRPEKIATAFDALPNASQEQCRELARQKLDEAIRAIVASLVKT